MIRYITPIPTAVCHVPDTGRDKDMNRQFEAIADWKW